VIKTDKLASIFTLVNAAREEIWQLDFRSVIIGDGVIATVRDQGDSPHVAFEVSPSPDDGFTIETYFTAVHVKIHVTPCITKDRD